MNRKNRLLGRRRREATRKVARRCYILNGPEAEPDPDQLRTAIEADSNFQGIMASLLIAIAVKLAVALITHWLNNRTAVPASGFQTGEPGA